MTEQQQRLAWIKQWQKAGPLLEYQSRVELRKMSVLQRQWQIENLLNLASEFHQTRMDNGLVKLKSAFAEMFDQ